MTQVNNPMYKVRALQSALYTAAKQNPTSWESRGSFGVNTIGEPCDRKGPARFDWEASMAARSTLLEETIGISSHAYRLTTPCQCLTLQDTFVCEIFARCFSGSIPKTPARR